MSETAGAGDPAIFDATTDTFEASVVLKSSEVPVVVDFWAPWCNPCLQLGPVLEKLAREYGGRFLLAKVNIDQSPEVAAEFGVRSIPAVFALKNAQVADAFMGVQSESSIRGWIDRILPTEAERITAEGAKHEANHDLDAAEARYLEAVAQSPDFPDALIGLVRVALEREDLDAARLRIEALERRGFLEPEAEKLKAEILLRDQARGAGSVDAARAALAQSPDDLERKFALAEALAAAGEYAEALPLCLDLVERDRKGVGEKARKTMVAIFQLLPPGSELVTEYQRQLSFAL
jgi:putative thioredoxin